MMTLVGLLKVIRRHIIPALIALVVVVAGMSMYAFTRIPTYSATATVFASYKGGESVSTRYSATSYINTQLKSYPNLVKTEAILQPVIAELGLQISVNDLAASVFATRPNETYMIDITVSGTDPEEAAEIANAVAASLRDRVSTTLYSSDPNVASPINLSIVQSAQVPKWPSSAGKKNIIAAGVALGVLVGAVLAIVLDLMDKTIRQASDLQEILEAPVLGLLSHNDVYAGKAPVVISRPVSRESEEVRRLRMNLMYIMSDTGKLSNLIVITSAGVSEGKTTVSMNLAAAYAEAGKKTLLIDADLRNPSMADALSLDGSVGLSQLLTHQVDFADAIQRYWRENLYILPAGKRVLNPSILFNSKTMHSLLEQMSDVYDYVIIDTAPLKVSTDAAIFSKEGAAMLFVSGLDRGSKQDVRAVVEDLETLDVTIAGSVINFSKTERTMATAAIAAATRKQDSRHRNHKSSQKNYKRFFGGLNPVRN